jgi:hypothetical protein
MKGIAIDEKDKMSLLEKKLSLNTAMYEQDRKNKKVLI